jgi:hypothetical protein
VVDGGALHCFLQGRDGRVQIGNNAGPLEPRTQKDPQVTEAPGAIGVFGRGVVEDAPPDGNDSVECRRIGRADQLLERWCEGCGGPVGQVWQQPFGQLLVGDATDETEGDRARATRRSSWARSWGRRLRYQYSQPSRCLPRHIVVQHTGKLRLGECPLLQQHGRITLGHNPLKPCPQSRQEFRPSGHRPHPRSVDPWYDPKQVSAGT